LKIPLVFYSYSELDPRKISSGNMIERLNREIRRRTYVVWICPNEASYVQLVTAYLDGILRRLVEIQGLYQREIHHDIAAERSCLVILIWAKGL
jgi:transposase-like protein